MAPSIHGTSIPPISTWPTSGQLCHTGMDLRNTKLPSSKPVLHTLAINGTHPAKKKTRSLHHGRRECENKLQQKSTRSYQQLQAMPKGGIYIRPVQPSRNRSTSGSHRLAWTKDHITPKKTIPKTRMSREETMGNVPPIYKKHVLRE